MLMCKYKEGKWEEAEIVPFQALSLTPGTHVFHYGQAVFEGMKAHNSINNETFSNYI